MKYQSTESGSLKMMHRHKILTYMSFVCLMSESFVCLTNKCQNRKVKKVGHIEAQLERMGRDESDPAT